MHWDQDNCLEVIVVRSFALHERGSPRGVALTLAPTGGIYQVDVHILA